MISPGPTSEPMQRVLIIDHDRRFVADARLLVDMQPNMELVAWLPDCRSAVRYAEDVRPDVVVFGWSWDVGESVRELRRLSDTEYKPAIIVFADDGNLGAFVAAKRSGAVTWPGYSGRRCDISAERQLSPDGEQAGIR